MVQWLGLHTFTAKRRFNPWLEGGAVELRSKELCGEAKKKKKKVGREPWRQGVSLWLLPCLDEAT